MQTISVIEEIGPVCVDPEDGGALYRQCYTALSQGVDLILDFSGVKTLTSSFLNAALGCLFANFTIDTLTQKLYLARVSVRRRRIAGNPASSTRPLAGSTWLA
jgi:hypothetical protein